jgi:regulatory protein
MEITKISKIGKQDKFGIFIDGVLKIFLSGQSVLDSDLYVGMPITDTEIEKLNHLSSDDQLYSKALKYISIRLRSEGELKDYLKRKGASQVDQKEIVDKLKDLDLINDERFSEAFIHDKLLRSPASKRKIAVELKKKQIAEDIINKSIGNDQLSDEASLNTLIASKRRQTKYQDDLKLMQYLVRNGFNYGDVKRALKEESL